MALAPSSTAWSPSSDRGVAGELRRVDRQTSRGDDLDHRVDRRHEVAHVAHVGAADDGDVAVRARRRVRPSAPALAAYSSTIGLVVEHVGVRRIASTSCVISQPAACAPASRQASTRALSGSRRVDASRERTYHSATARVGHDVRLVAGVGEDAVDALVGQDVLAQGGDVHVAEHGGVERVAPLVRERGGVGGLALVVDPRAAGWR